MSYSPNLTYFLDRLSGFSTNIFKLESQTPVTAGPNSIIRFNLPANALLNMRSFALHFTADTNSKSGATSGARLPNKIESLVERVEVSVGGVQLSAGSNYYNVLCHAKQALMGNRCDAALGHPEIVRAKSYVDGAAITTTNNETYTGTDSHFCIDKWEGFLGSCEPKVIDSSLLPDIVVSIYLTDTSVMTTSLGVNLDGTGATAASFRADGAGGASFELTNIHATIEALGLADAAYDTMVSQMISQRGYIEVPFKQYIAFQDITGSAMRFSVATACLDRIWVAHRRTGYNTQGAPVTITGYKVPGCFTSPATIAATNGAAGAVTQEIGLPDFDAGGNFDFNKERYTSKYFNFQEPASGTSMKYQFQLNGAMYPQFQASFEEMHQISRNSVMSQTCAAKDMPMKTLKDNYAVQCIRLNLPESEYSRTLSGLDTRGISLNGFYNLTNATASTGCINLFAECTSVLRIGSGKQMELVQ